MEKLFRILNYAYTTTLNSDVIKWETREFKQDRTQACGYQKQNCYINRCVIKFQMYKPICRYFNYIAT